MRTPTLPSQKKKDQGFTLIELLVVVVIIGVLAAIAIPVFLSQREKAANSATQSDLRNSAIVMETAFVEEGTYSTVVAADFKQSDNVTLTIASADDTAFCINGTNTTGDTDYHYDSDDGGLAEGPCV